MKIHKRLLPLLAMIALVFAVCFLPSIAQAADTATSGEVIVDPALPAVADTVAAPSTWQQAVIAIVTPLLIAGIKLLVPRIPGAWLPIIAAALGFLLDLIAHFATGTSTNGTLALLLGLAGVGVREAVDQVKKATTSGV